MDVTFVAQYTHYVISKHLSQMAFCGWVSKLTSQKSLLLPSTLTPYFLSSNFYLIIVLTGRQRREHRIFRSLLQMIPGLEERLIDGSDDEAVLVAEMVRALK
jgi:glycogen synthase